MSLKDRLVALTDSFVCLARKVWRPLTCLNLCGAVFVNMILIPLQNHNPIDFKDGATFVGAIVAAFAVREWGKVKGVQD